MRRLYLSVIATAIVSIAMSASAVVIGDFESDLDGWINWGGATSIAGGQTEGVTLGSGSVLVEQAGWGQSLAIKLQDNGFVADFFNNSIFSIDMSVAATPGITEGYTQLAAVSMNADGAGWQDVVSGNPINFYWWDGRPDETQTLVVDYSAYRDQVAANPTYVEIIIALNTGGGAPPEMYFDNAQLIPEPGTLALLGLGAMSLCIRRRRR